MKQFDDCQCGRVVEVVHAVLVRCVDLRTAVEAEFDAVSSDLPCVYKAVGEY